MDLKKINLFFVMVLLFLPPAVFAADWQWMTPQRTFSLIKEGSGLWLVDVRNEVAFTETHIEGAVHIPAALLPTKKLPREKIIVLVDDSLGLRSGRAAADVLCKKGHERVYLLEGGLLAWQADRYPLTGKTSGRVFRSVMPEDISWVQDQRIPLRLFDLRDKAAQDSAPVPQALAVPGTNLAERLNMVKEMLPREEMQGLAARLDSMTTTILVLPATAEPREQLARSFRGVPGDIRYLDGGYVAWAARPDKTITTVGACPTCPGGVAGGKK